MIGHIEHGSDFGGLFRYLLSKDKGARIIGGLAAGRTASELTQEFNNCADQRRTTTKPVKHLIISFAPQDGLVADEVKNRITRSAVKQLGYVRNQYVVVDHHRNDPGHDWNHDHDHIHIAVNMIDLDGKRTDDWQDKRKFEKILKGLEIEYGLVRTVPSQQRKFKACSHGQIQRIKRELKEYRQGQRTSLPKIPLMTELQAAIDLASKDQPTLTLFIARLQSLGVDVRPYISDKGRKRISYRYQDLKVRGSQLHNGSFPKLISQRGIDFNLSRDLPAMEAACSQKPVLISDSQEIVKWSQIDLTNYLPDLLQKEVSEINSPTQKSQPEPLEFVEQEELELQRQGKETLSKVLVSMGKSQLFTQQDLIDRIAPVLVQFLRNGELSNTKSFRTSNNKEYQVSYDPSAKRLSLKLNNDDRYSSIVTGVWNGQKYTADSPEREVELETNLVDHLSSELQQWDAPVSVSQEETYQSQLIQLVVSNCVNNIHSYLWQKHGLKITKNTPGIVEIKENSGLFSLNTIFKINKKDGNWQKDPNLTITSNRAKQLIGLINEAIIAVKDNEPKTQIQARQQIKSNERAIGE